VTSSGAGDEALRAVEAERAGEGLAPRLAYQGEWLGGSRFRGGIAIPAAVFDRLAPEQTPLEQAAYFHLFRLSFGEGLNWCRVGKRELMRRLRVSERRLNVALEGLVGKGHVKPLHRSTRGTLYRVYLPSEVLGTVAEPGLELGEKKDARAGSPAPPSAAARTPAPRTPAPAEIAPASPETSSPPTASAATRSRASRAKKPAVGHERPLESPLNEERFADVAGKKPAGPSLVAMVDWFFAQRGQPAKPAERQLAVAVLTGLLEDGFSRSEVNRAVEWFVQNHPREKNLERLPYFIETALEKG